MKVLRDIVLSVQSVNFIIVQPFLAAKVGIICDFVIQNAYFFSKKQKK